jgi:hypothetical protein
VTFPEIISETLAESLKETFGVDLTYYPGGDTEAGVSVTGALTNIERTEVEPTTGRRLVHRARLTVSAADIAQPAESDAFLYDGNTYDVEDGSVSGLPGGLWRMTLMRVTVLENILQRHRRMI